MHRRPQPGRDARILLVVLLAGFAASGCRDPLGPAADELAEARSRWSESGFTDYDYQFERICFCGFPLQEPVVVSVRGGGVAGVRSVATGEEGAIDDLAR